MKKLTLIFLIISATVQTTMAQSYQLDSKNSTLEVLGTSTLHDWEIVAEELAGNATITKAEEALSIDKLNFEVNVKGLKSGKSAMDNNTYEALKSKSFPKITYVLTKVLSANKVGATYNLETTGKLTIAGYTKTMNLPVKAEVMGNQVVFTGKVTFNMTDFKVDPPTALLGTVKTGDEITIQFKTKFIQ